MIPIVDLNLQQAKIKSALDDNIQSVLNHGQYIMGPEVSKFETKLSNFVGAEHCVTCASGTDALLVSLLAMGVGPGDAVLTPAFSFIAAAEAIALTGAVPIFVDIEKESFNISTSDVITKIESKENRNLNIKAIIPVNLFGLPCDYFELNSIANKYNLIIIEDAAQSFGAEYNSKLSCNLATIGCTSFFPSKPLGCYGDGGAIFTNSNSIFQNLKSLCLHGKGYHKYDSVRIGINSRLDTIQAAILLAKLDIFETEIKQREFVSEIYSALLQAKDIETPQVFKNKKSVWAQYSILTKNTSHRGKICERFSKLGIGYGIYYPVPLHLQSVFSYLNYKKGDLPVSECCADRILSLPMHPYLTKEDQEKICSAIY